MTLSQRTSYLSLRSEFHCSPRNPQLDRRLTRTPLRHYDNGLYVDPHR